MALSSLTSLATVTASTKRAAISAGKRGTPTTHLTSFLCVPLNPTAADLRQRLGLNTKYELLQTFADGDIDIKEGDVLVVAGRDYPVVTVGDWVYRSQQFKEIIVEDLKR